jgi:hypothetical protein
VRTLPGVTLFDFADSGPAPFALIAWTVNETGEPARRPVTVVVFVTPTVFVAPLEAVIL